MGSCRGRTPVLRALRHRRPSPARADSALEEFEAAPDPVIASLEAGLLTPASRADFRRRVSRAGQAHEADVSCGDATGLVGVRSSCRAAR